MTYCSRREHKQTGVVLARFRRAMQDVSHVILLTPSSRGCLMVTNLWMPSVFSLGNDRGRNIVGLEFYCSVDLGLWFRFFDSRL
jgi:hypothetical protein